MRRKRKEKRGRGEVEVEVSMYSVYVVDSESVMEIVMEFHLICVGVYASLILV